MSMEGGLQAGHGPFSMGLFIGKKQKQEVGKALFNSESSGENKNPAQMSFPCSELLIPGALLILCITIHFPEQDELVT